MQTLAYICTYSYTLILVENTQVLSEIQLMNKGNKLISIR